MEPEKFFDINRFPKYEGMILFPISMSRISNAQNAEECFKYMEHFIPKIIKPAVGLNFIYSDTLYLNSTEPAITLKRKYESLMHAHKYAFINLIEKHPKYIPNSFNFVSWSQMLLEAKDFMGFFGHLKKIYKNDETFQKLMKVDLKDKSEITENDENFILEEILMFYLASKGSVQLKNDYVSGKQKWILWCYPGKPLFSEIYLYKKNFFNLHNEDNVFENCYYDLTDKKLYDYNKINLEDLGD
jgi:hypothetical protein